MTINGSTNTGGWTYKLEVTETSTSLQNRTSTIQVKTYIGRANSQSYLGGTYSNSVTCAGQTQTQSGTIAYPTYINAGSWLQLKTFTFTVSNTGTPTTISISSSMSSGDFSPSYASASGTMQLTVLHLSPTIQTAEVSELNTVVSNLNIPATTCVRYLSKKRFTLHATPYDSATLSYRIIGTGYNSGTQASNIIDVDFRTAGQNIAFNESNRVEMSQVITDSMGGQTVGDINVLINNTPSLLDTIKYDKPILERNSTYIKRKSGEYSSILGRDANLTDGIASINVVGNIYKGNDVVGTNNAIRTIGYKVWLKDTTEPVNYTAFNPVPTPSNTGEVTITDYEISNIVFTSAYNYKIILEDTYSDGTTYYSDIASGTIPLGQPTWTEYKDHVDFLALSKQGNNIPAPFVLYDGLSGTSGDVTLSDSCANYDYIEIYYYNSSYQDVYSSVKVYDPDSKNVCLQITFPNYANSRMYVVGAYYTCNGSTLTFNEGYGLAIASNNIYGVGTDTIKIDKVIGYK